MVFLRLAKEVQAGFAAVLERIGPCVVVAGSKNSVLWRVRRKAFIRGGLKRAFLYCISTVWHPKWQPSSPYKTPRSQPPSLCEIYRTAAFSFQLIFLFRFTSRLRSDPVPILGNRIARFTKL